MRGLLLSKLDVSNRAVLLWHWMEKQSWELALGENGREALGILSKSPPHLMMLKVRVPWMDDLEFTAEVPSTPRSAASRPRRRVLSPKGTEGAALCYNSQKSAPVAASIRHPSISAEPLRDFICEILDFRVNRHAKSGHSK